MPASNSKKPRANIELILLGFLVSLILKGLLDHIYGADIEHAKGWREIGAVIWNAHPLEVFVFLFALLRFMYGAYRFHELGPTSARSNRVLWDLVFTVLLFIGFYFASLSIKYQPIQFYEIFAATHFIDLLWFLPLIRLPPRLFSAGEDFGEEAAPRFVVLDCATIFSFLGFFWWSGLIRSLPAPSHSLDWLGWTLILIGVLDLWWNSRFYFHKIDFRKDIAPGVPRIPSKSIYFAGPLFTQAEWRWNVELAERLRRLGLKIELPQEIAAAVLQETGGFDPEAIYRQNVAAMDAAAAVVAILDGADPDSGTSWECGYAHRAGKPVIGIRTDLRAAGDDPSTATNLMLGKSCRRIVQLPPDRRDDIQWLAAETIRALDDLESPQQIVAAPDKSSSGA
jgi:nucleoside 2-deoxyribosyltransferase